MGISGQRNPNSGLRDSFSHSSIFRDYVSFREFSIGATHVKLHLNKIGSFVALVQIAGVRVDGVSYLEPDGIPSVL